MEPSDDIQAVLLKLPDRYWTGPKLVVRGLYRYEHAGFGGAFSPGEYVTLERKPGNAYDKNAVKVILADGKMLGYIAKEMAIALSRELAAAIEIMKREEQGPYSLGHDLMHFLSDWMTYGYDKAVVLCKGDLLSEDEIPPRYVYPERILKRGFQHADSGANPVVEK